MLTRLSAALGRIVEIETRLAELQPARAGCAAPEDSFDQALQAARVSAGRPQPTPRAPRTAGATGEFDAVISAAAQRHGVDADLVHAVIRAESNYRSGCRSTAGAMGLMQLMPGTARSLGVSDPWDPAQNVDGGVRYLRQQLDRFGEVDLALAAYNAGPGAVKRYDGVPPYRETQAYVKRVMQYLWERKSD